MPRQREPKTLRQAVHSFRQSHVCPQCGEVLLPWSYGDNMKIMLLQHLDHVIERHRDCWRDTAQDMLDHYTRWLSYIVSICDIIKEASVDGDNNIWVRDALRVYMHRKPWCLLDQNFDSTARTINSISQQLADEAETRAIRQQFASLGVFP